jgi:hypothetical protein
MLIGIIGCAEFMGQEIVSLAQAPSLLIVENVRSLAGAREAQ